MAVNCGMVRHKFKIAFLASYRYPSSAKKKKWCTPLDPWEKLKQNYMLNYFAGSCRTIRCLLQIRFIYHGVRDINDNLAKYANFRKSWPFWWHLGSGDPILTWAKHDSNGFERTLDELSKTFFYSLRCLGAELVHRGFWRPRTKPSLLEPARNKVNPRRHREGLMQLPNDFFRNIFFAYRSNVTNFYIAYRPSFLRPPENFNTLTPWHLTYDVNWGSCQAENAFRGTFQPVTCEHRRFC